MTQALMIRPSNLDLIVACNASLQLEAQVPELPETEEEAEGTFAHWIALRYAAGFHNEFPVGSSHTMHGRMWQIDDDMHLGALMYLRAVGGIHGHLRLEDGVGVPRVHPTCAGTPDAWRFIMDAREVFVTCPAWLPADKFAAGRCKVLRVVDYKYGHRYVEVFENYQLSAYVLGVMNRLSLTDNDEDLYVELTLVQPRAYHPEGPVRTWAGDARMIRATINVASSAAHAAMGPNPLATVNPRCIDCRARFKNCKTLARAVTGLVDYSGSAELMDMPPDAVGRELAIVQDAIKRLEARANGLEAQAESHLRAGKPVAMFGLDSKPGHLAWNDDVTPTDAIQFGDLMGVDLRKTPTMKTSVLTPTQAIQKGIDATVMDSYARRPRGAVKLTRIDSTTIRKVFNT